MSEHPDDPRYRRGIRTLLACWRSYAACARPGAAVERLRGVTVAVFPDEPERSIYNNAVLDRHLSRRAQAAALDEMHERYAAAGISEYAAWVHEADTSLAAELEGRGYRLAETTRAMALELDQVTLATPVHDAWPLDWPVYLRTFELPGDLLMSADTCRLYVLAATWAGTTVAAAASFDDRADCGIYNVETLEHARRRGFAASVTAHQRREARDRGCHTASLQATPMAERLYASLGFRDLGRILEFVPPRAPGELAPVAHAA
jgi:GNAT superfamily N-acetyltransferase